MKHIIFAIAILFISLFLCAIPQNAYAQDNPNNITFDNKSGETALVKVIGPSGQIVEVPNGQSRTVNASAGKYYILVRYGRNPKKYKYAKGDPFTMTQTATQYSAITITLHKVVGGNYPAHPISREEFDMALAAETPSLRSAKFVALDSRFQLTVESVERTMIIPSEVKAKRYRPADGYDFVIIRLRIDSLQDGHASPSPPEILIDTQKHEFSPIGFLFSVIFEDPADFAHSDIYFKEGEPGILVYEVPQSAVPLMLLFPYRITGTEVKRVISVSLKP